MSDRAKQLAAGLSISDLACELRKAFKAGEYPALTFTREPEVLEVGQTITLTPRVSIRIESRHQRKGAIHFPYTVIDNRDWYLRPGLPTTSFEADEEGLPVEPTEENIKQAAHESAYCGNFRDPLDAGLVVPPEYQNVLDIQAKARHAEHHSENREQQARQDVVRLNARMKAAINQAIRMGVDPMNVLIAIERQLAELERESERAA